MLYLADKQGSADRFGYSRQKFRYKTVKISLRLMVDEVLVQKLTNIILSTVKLRYPSPCE